MMKLKWKELSLLKKVYIFIIIMTILVAFELKVLFFAIETSAAIRAFVGGEGLWSKAQKDAVHSLHNYNQTRDPAFYQRFKELIQIPLGDKKARLELEKPNPNMEIVFKGFLQGQVHYQDIENMAQLIHRFRSASYIQDALSSWRQGDLYMDQLILEAAVLHDMISKKQSSQRRAAVLARINILNSNLTAVENRFSATLGEGARWLERQLFLGLLIVICTVVLTSNVLIFAFARSLVSTLREMIEIARQVGSGDFSKQIAIKSNDEIGQLAQSLNQMSQELRANIGERVQAENANRIKSLFLAHMSHEIRTPLGAILGFTELLKENNLSDEERQKNIEIIERTGQDLAKIINDILDITKVEADHLDIDEVSFSLPKLMSEVYELLNLKCIEKSIQLIFVQSGPIPYRMKTDPIRLRQIIMNVIGNAIKFTNHGKVTVTYRAYNGKLTFLVKDTGIGITKEQQHSLFQVFSQADNSITREFEGTGLGLVLSRRLARMLGGDVTLESSEFGQGSTFKIDIAIHEVDSMKRPTLHNHHETETPKDDFSILKNKKILLVEDSPDNQLLIQKYLSKYAVNLTTANNGQEAVHATDINHFDLILMDMQMPVLDGYNATSILRKKGLKIPIIALTAHAMKDDRAKCLNAGCTDYITKPIHRIQFLESIVKNLPKANSEFNPQSSSSSPNEDPELTA